MFLSFVPLSLLNVPSLHFRDLLGLGSSMIQQLSALWRRVSVRAMCTEIAAALSARLKVMKSRAYVRTATAKSRHLPGALAEMQTSAEAGQSGIQASIRGIRSGALGTCGRAYNLQIVSLLSRSAVSFVRVSVQFVLVSPPLLLTSRSSRLVLRVPFDFAVDLLDTSRGGRAILTF